MNITHSPTIYSSKTNQSKIVRESNIYNDLKCANKKFTYILHKSIFMFITLCHIPLFSPQIMNIYVSSFLSFHNYFLQQHICKILFEGSENDIYLFISKRFSTTNVNPDIITAWEFIHEN